MKPQELATNFLSFLNTLSTSQLLKQWSYRGKSVESYGSPAGGWKNQEGFEFFKAETGNSIILRGVPDFDGKNYIVLESINLASQLYNIDLNNKRIHSEEDNMSTIRESFNMTVGKKRKESEVKEVFEEFGINTDFICSINNASPNWIDFTISLLEWGLIREKVRLKLQAIASLKLPDMSEKSSNKEFENDLNQILFGPPGTGKTFNTINKALEIINEKEEQNLDWKNREQVKKLFDKRIEEGRIVFTTFHQSMSYEDFVEGIKPLKPQQEDTFVKYEVQSGIFKRICQDAKTPNSTKFDKAYDLLKEELLKIEILNLKTPTGKEFGVSLNSKDNLSLLTGLNKNKQGTLTKENIQRQINGEVKFEGWEGYFLGVLNYLKTNYGYSDLESEPNKPYVLIIDEINRGNVSQIFGELITLIEDDKRLGKEEALTATLPYSKESFGVPPNLYILGTMNTADRSVEALDAALRRRFSFIEMPPLPANITAEGKLKGEYDKIANINLEDVLTTINNRLEKLFDKDHLIGHSYFFNIGEIKDLKSAFQNKIIPLLQEYFFGDYGKLGLVLGEGFFEKPIYKSEHRLFSKFYDYSDEDYLDRPIYKLKNVSDLSDDEFVNAINNLLNK